MTHKKWKFIFGEEVGELGTPHLQGYIEHTAAIRKSTLVNLFPKVHFEIARGNTKQNVSYCSKDNNVVTNIIIKKTDKELYDEYMHSIYDQVTWKPWQKKILDIFDTTPDDRTVHWIYEEIGCAGKSFLARYLVWKHPTIVANGKQTDIFNQYSEYFENKHDGFPKIAIIDIPRSHENYVCYSTLEKIKDGYFYSGKYHGKLIQVLPHHLICFANFYPDIYKISQDRWNIMKINSDYNLDYQQLPCYKQELH